MKLNFGEEKKKPHPSVALVPQPPAFLIWGKNGKLSRLLGKRQHVEYGWQKSGKKGEELLGVSFLSLNSFFSFSNSYCQPALHGAADYHDSDLPQHFCRARSGRPSGVRPGRSLPRSGGRARLSPAPRGPRAGHCGREPPSSILSFRRLGAPGPPTGGHRRGAGRKRKAFTASFDDK